MICEQWRIHTGGIQLELQIYCNAFQSQIRELFQNIFNFYIRILWITIQSMDFEH